MPEEEEWELEREERSGNEASRQEVSPLELRVKCGGIVCHGGCWQSPEHWPRHLEQILFRSEAPSDVSQKQWRMKVLL